MFTVIKAWVATLALIGSIDQARVDQLVKASAQLKKGDDEARVLALLGQPVARWPRRSSVAAFILGDRPPQWAYGTFLEMSEIVTPDSVVPSVLPLRLRLFGPDEDDLVIIWDDHGKNC